MCINTNIELEHSELGIFEKGSQAGQLLSHAICRLLEEAPVNIILRWFFKFKKLTMSTAAFNGLVYFSNSGLCILCHMGRAALASAVATTRRMYSTITTNLKDKTLTSRKKPRERSSQGSKDKGRKRNKRRGIPTRPLARQTRRWPTKNSRSQLHPNLESCGSCYSSWSKELTTILL